MPEYLSPGVYIEETSYRAKSIQGVATSTTGFVGLCGSGPVQGPPPLVTSFEEYRRTFGDLDDLLLNGQPTTNYMAYAAKAFFDNGGQRLYVARIIDNGATAASGVIQKGGFNTTTQATPGNNDFQSGGQALNPGFFALYPGALGNLPVAVSATRGGNLLSGGKVMGARLGDVVQVVPAGGRALPSTVAMSVSTGNTLTVPNHGLAANQAVTFTAGTGGALPAGLPAGTSYVVNPTPNTFQVASAPNGSPAVLTGAGTLPFSVATTSTTNPITNVTLATNALTVANHGLSPGQAVTFAAGTGGTLPAPLQAGPGTTYYVIYKDANTFQVASAPGTTTPVPLTTTGTAPFSVTTVVTPVSKAVTAVTPFALTVPNHGFTANQVVSFVSTGTPPTGLQAATASGAPPAYYVVNPTTNTFQVALTAGGTPVSITGVGTGALTVLTLAPGQLYSVSFDQQGNAVLTDSSGNSPVLATAVAVQRVSLTVSVGARGAQIDTYSGLSTYPASPSYIATVLRSTNPTDPHARVYFGFNPSGANPALTLTATDFAALFVSLAAQTSQSQMQLQNGSDGIVPTTSDLWVGQGADATATGLTALADVDDVAIVAAPDCSTFQDQNLQHSIRNALITHCENLKYRFAILSGPDGSDESQIQNVRGQMDSTYAAFYYPWVTIENPFSQTGELMNLPPEGYMAGIYARVDDQRGVYKAPANEVVLGALKFARNVNKGMQDVLNPNGINCLRFFQDRGYRVWGARTISSDPDWTYLNVRRLFIYLEHSIDKSTQWVVFEPNNSALWTKVRLTIEGFLLDVWRTGALLGSKPEEAFFVRCDRSTMTQSDLDNGRLVVLIGVAPTKPAEFVIFRIGQWTADASII